MIAAVMRFYGTGPNSREPPVFETARENFMSWISGVIELADPYRPLIFPGGYNPTYDTNLWTIPVEFHGSMMIFLTLLGIAKLHGPFRMAILVCSVLFLFYNVYNQIFLFMSGVLLAELHHFRESRAAGRQSTGLQGLQAMEMEEPKEHNIGTDQYHTKAIPLFWTCNFILSLFVCSMPLQIHGSAQSPGYMTLASLVPASYSKPYVEDCFWIPLGAFNLIWTLDNAKFLQIIFTNRFSQYLGKISFALYIVHGTFLYTLGWHLSAFMLSYTGGDTGPHYAFGLILTGLIMYPLIFWTADMVARHVDARSVKFARWLWLKAIAPS